MLSPMRTIFLVGPTAVGKSAVALELAERLGAEIVSADSMQVYRGLDIGTAKPTLAERSCVLHHLIDICDPGEVFDVKRYVGLAQAAIASCKTALVVGGTGMYIRALRRGLFDGPSRDVELRARLEAMTAAELFGELQRLDPQTAARIDRQNPRRLVRALEVFHATGKPISELQTQWPVEQASRLFDSGPANRRDACSTIFCLTRERSDLVARIERRIDAQIASGWLDEARRLDERLCHINVIAMTSKWTALQAAGYRELIAHLRGEFTLAEAVALIKTRTRQLAKRQMTWFRHEPGVRWIAVAADEPPTTTAERILEELKTS
jgi:tRNA dimethylallyltransferase